MKHFSLLASILLLVGTTTYAQKPKLDGLWRGVFSLSNAAEAPFNFELKGQTAWLLIFYHVIARMIVPYRGNA